MAFAPGEFITAQRLNRLQDVEYFAEGGTVAAGLTNADIPGVTLTFTTETDNASAVCWWTVDFDPSGVPGGTSTSRLLLDGATSSTRFISFFGGAATDRDVCTAQETFTLSPAGSHTIKAQATTATNIIVSAYCSLRVIVKEIV